MLNIIVAFLRRKCTHVSQIETYEIAFLGSNDALNINNTQAKYKYMDRYIIFLFIYRLLVYCALHFPISLIAVVAFIFVGYSNFLGKR